MNTDNIKILTQGVKGANVKNMNVGYALICLRHDEDRIIIDDFEGAGATYKQRETQLIQVIQNGEILFEGSKHDLFDLLRKSKSYENA